MEQPEKLSVWDRWFNRTRKEVMEEGEEAWNHYPHGPAYPEVKTKYSRSFVKYKVIDRVTGSETIEKKYLN